MRHPSTAAALKFEALATATQNGLPHQLEEFIRNRSAPADIDETMVVECLGCLERLTSDLLADYEPLIEDDRDLLLMYVFELFLSNLYRSYLEGRPDSGPKSIVEFCRLNGGPQFLDGVAGESGKPSYTDSVRKTVHSLFALLVRVVTPGSRSHQDAVLAAGVLFSILSDAFGLPMELSSAEAEELSDCYQRIAQAEDEGAAERASNVVVRAMLRNGRELGHTEDDFKFQPVRGLPVATSVRYLRALSFYALVLRMNMIRGAAPDFFESLHEGFRQLEASDPDSEAS